MKQIQPLSTVNKLHYIMQAFKFQDLDYPLEGYLFITHHIT